MTTPTKRDEAPWIPPAPEETPGSRFSRKAKENPLVPIGCFATLVALGYGLLSFKRGNMLMSQNMMRFRVVAQGGTVIALVGGIALAAKSK
jgi:hypothetical protein